MYLTDILVKLLLERESLIVVEHKVMDAILYHDETQQSIIDH